MPEEQEKKLQQQSRELQDKQQTITNLQLAIQQETKQTQVEKDKNIELKQQLTALLQKEQILATTNSTLTQTNTRYETTQRNLTKKIEKLNQQLQEQIQSVNFLGKQLQQQEEKLQQQTEVLKEKEEQIEALQKEKQQLRHPQEDVLPLHQAVPQENLEEESNQQHEHSTSSSSTTSRNLLVDEEKSKSNQPANNLPVNQQTLKIIIGLLDGYIKVRSSFFYSLISCLFPTRKHKIEEATQLMNTFKSSLIPTFFYSQVYEAIVKNTNNALEKNKNNSNKLKTCLDRCEEALNQKQTRQNFSK